jgi:hypothetical protein
MALACVIDELREIRRSAIECRHLYEFMVLVVVVVFQFLRRKADGPYVVELWNRDRTGSLVDFTASFLEVSTVGRFEDSMDQVVTSMNVHFEQFLGIALVVKGPMKAQRYTDTERETKIVAMNPNPNPMSDGKVVISIFYFYTH